MVVSVYVIVRSDLVIPPVDVMFIVFLGAILSAVVGFVFYFKALEISELSKVATIQSFNPFVVFVYSLIFLGSTLTGLQLVGGMVIGLGAFFLVLARHRPKIVERLFPNF